MDKRKILCYVLTLIVLFLFAYSMYGTATFLGIHASKNDETSETTQSLIEKTKNEKLQMQGNTSGNLLQHYQEYINKEESSNGMMAMTKKHIYKSEKINNKYVITQTEIKSGDRFPLISGYKCRNLLILDDYIFCIIETQNKEEIICDKIAKISVDGDEIKIFDSTESLKITSMVSDGEEIYYTKQDNKNIYKINLSGDIYSYIYTLEDAGENPYLFGIKDGNLYYVDGYEMAYINLGNYEKENISYQYCNKNQFPILEDGKIFVFDTLSKTELSYIDLTTNKVETIFTQKDFIKLGVNSINISNINYYKNYIFFSLDKDIYYININTKSNGKITDTYSPTNILFFNDNYLLTEKELFGVYEQTPIAYILAK